MIKDIINSNESKNIHDDDIQFLKEHFPSCFTKQTVDYSGNIIPSKFDIEKLKKIIDPKIDIIQEGYGLDFLGKTYARYISSLQSETVLVPDTEHNSKEENKTSENIYISGDNIDALKHLLKSYEQSVKCIYIDPPYNTGSDDFVYKDNFNFSKDDLQKKLNLTSDETERVLDLTNRGSSSHSAWLMFMYPRLLLARGLLKDDGVIFISIDDNEQADLKLLCDDVFGEENFVTNMIWQSTPGSNTGSEIKTVTEYVLMYAKKINMFISKTRPVENSDKYIFEDDFVTKRGKYLLNKLDRRMTGVHYSEALNYSIKTPDGTLLYPGCTTTKQPHWNWRWSEKKVEWGIENKFIIFNKINNRWTIYFKQYFNVNNNDEVIQRSLPYQNLIVNEEGISSSTGTADVMNLFSSKVFDYPKPVNLIKLLIDTVIENDDIVLDFFSGSGTTAQAVLSINKKDRKKIKYILVQLDEEIKKESEIIKSGYKTIDQIGMKRIELAAAKIKSENTNLFSEENPLDLGFKHYTLKTVPQNTLDKLESFSESTLISDSSILSEFGEPTVLSTWMCHDGYGLTSTYTEIDLGDYTAYLCGKHLYFINSGFTEKNVLALCKLYEEKSDFTPDKIIVFGYSFTMSVLNTLKANVRVFKDTEKNLDISVDIRY